MAKKIIIGSVIVIVVVFMIFFNVMKKDTSDTTSGFGSKKGIEVEVESIYKGSIAATVLATGKVEEISKKEIMTDLPIKIMEIFVEEGDVVKKGTKLFSVDLESLEDDLLRLQVNKETGLLQLKKMQDMPATTSTASAKIAVELADLSVTSATKTKERQASHLEVQQSLFDEGIIATSELDIAKNMLEDAERQLQIAVLNSERSNADLGSLYKNNKLGESNLSLDIEIQLKNIESIDLSINKIEKQLADMKSLMLSPIDGVVTALNIQAFTMAPTVQPVMIVTDIVDLKVKLNIKEYDIPKIKEGQKVIITGDAIDEETNVMGTLSYVAPIAKVVVSGNRQVTAVEVDVTITDGSDFLKPGYTADCEIVTEVNDSALIANFNMLVEDKKGNTTIYVVNDLGQVEERNITIGITSDFDVEIIDGVKEGELIVINPSLALKDGTKVQIINKEESKEETK